MFSALEAYFKDRLLDINNEFRMMMGWTTGLDKSYYYRDNPDSHEKILSEYWLALDRPDSKDSLTINDENRSKKQLEVKDAVITRQDRKSINFLLICFICFIVLFKEI